jgi:hypothetical protein
MTGFIRKTAVSLFLTILALSLTPTGKAQITLDQQKRSARILSTGVVDGTTIPAWLNQTTPVVHTRGSGYYTLNFSSPFTSPPNCVVTAELKPGVSWTWAEIYPPTLDAPQSLSSLTIDVYQPGLGGLGVTDTEGAFRIICMPDQIVAVSSAAFNITGGNFIFNPNNWIAGVVVANPGVYTITFATPYTSQPSCTASPMPSGTSASGTIQVQTSPTTLTLSTQSFTTTLPSTPFPQNVVVFLTCTGTQPM